MAIDFDAQVHLADLRLRVLAWVDLKKRHDKGEKLTPQELLELETKRLPPEQYRDLFLDLSRGRDMAAAATRAAAAKARRSATPKAPTNIDIQKLFNGE